MLDTGKKDDILFVDAKVLDEFINLQVNGEIMQSKVEGRVSVKENAKIINSSNSGSCIIGEKCLAKNPS